MSALGKTTQAPGADQSRTRDLCLGIGCRRRVGAPPSEAMIAFINDHREAYGIEPICKVLPIALSTYHAHIAQRIDPSKRSARAQRDEALKIEVRRVFEENFRVYGRKHPRCKALRRN